MPRKLTLLLILITFCLKAFPAVFVVTSNADSGPGTLRDALTQAAAADSTQTNYINFNLTDVSDAGRTITLLSNLPYLCSNIVIDGSTQQGAKFGVSDAKIKIIAQINVTTCCFNLENRHDIGIYGLLFDTLNPDPSTFNDIYAIIGIHAKNITIGAPGKGNITKNLNSIFFNFYGGETDETVTQNIKISSNILGLNEDGETISNIGVCINAFRVKNLTIGGNTAAEGNKIVGQVNISESSYVDFYAHTGDLLIANNYFGSNFTGTKKVPNVLTGSTLGVNGYYLSTAQIVNNLFISRSDLGIGVNCFFKITGNKFGTDITGGNVLGIFQFPIVISYCNNGGIIGGQNSGDANIFAGAYQDINPNATINSGAILNVGTPNIEITGNSFKCNNTNRPYELELVGDTKFYTTIKSRNDNTISGTATPNSRVDLYYSLSCDHCEPEKQFQSVPADVDGNWSYSGTLLNNNIIAASTYQGTTSEFTTLRFTNQPTDVKITMACGSKNGSITGITSNLSVKYAWYDSNGNIVATTKDLLNAPVGKYYLVVSDGYCSITSPIYEIKDAASQINTSNEKVSPSSCNQQDGSITGIQTSASSSFIWTDVNGNVVGNYLDLTNVAAGSYTLTVTASDGSCPQILKPIVIANTTGPNIDESTVKIQSTNCGQSTGSISNLTVTGTGALQYAWMNAQQQTVGTDPNLINQPAGTYKLQVTDDTQCGPVYSSVFTIPETNGITIDSSKKVVTVASCGSNTGSITGIQVNGAASYKWTDANGSTLITTTPDILNVAAGIYTLTTSNEFGCILTSSPIVIPLKLSTPLPVYAATYTNACNLQNNGAVTVATDGLVKSARWVDASGNTVGSGSSLTGVVAGTYKLYLTDQNGCENYYNSYTIQQYPEFTVSGYGNVTADACDLNSGAVDNTTIMGGIPPYTYTWTDANNKLIATTNAISNLAAGTYNLNVIDNGCGNVDITYTVTETTNIIAAPSVSDMQLCSSGSGIIVVNNASATATYRLYGGPSNTTPLDEEKGGRFNINSAGNQTYYVSEVSGSCESPRARLQVTVGLSSLNIANAFTPNGDGINDYWQVNNIQSYPDALVQIYNRYGQKLFESKGYVKPFDGTYNGQKLAAGVYYYIINLNNKCNILSGSLTLIR